MNSADEDNNKQTAQLFPSDLKNFHRGDDENLDNVYKRNFQHCR